jgi:hypothetical protein
MQTRSVNGLRLHYGDGDIAAADIVADACSKSLRIIRDRWALQAPRDCQVYVMTSWREFMFSAAPPHWRVLVAVTQPLWAPRADELWRVAGGFHQAFGRRRAVGVKPPRLLADAAGDIGERIFRAEEALDLTRKLEHITCHELTHACAADRHLPMWLNEGLAMRTVDLYAGEPTVRSDTLHVLHQASTSGEPIRYRDVRADDHDALVYHAVRGYWITRYLEESHPDVLVRLLSKRHSSRKTTAALAKALAIDPEELWQTIDGAVVAHFGAGGDRKHREG